MKGIVAFVLTFLLGLLGFAVMKGLHSPSCESFANEYLSADNHVDRERIMQRAIDVGCNFTK